MRVIAVAFFAQLKTNLLFFAVLVLAMGKPKAAAKSAGGETACPSTEADAGIKVKANEESNGGTFTRIGQQVACLVEKYRDSLIQKSSYRVARLVHVHDIFTLHDVVDVLRSQTIRWCMFMTYLIFMKWWMCCKIMALSHVTPTHPRTHSGSVYI